MLIWVCALHCEAKPIIDFYRLKKSTGNNDFDIYQSDQINCIVSGMGEQSMQKAIAWSDGFLKPQQQAHWINLGIAGHKSLPLGTAVLGSKFTQQNNPGWISAHHNPAHSFTLMPVTSLCQQQTDYDESSLFDMEAYAFIQATSRLSPIDRCHSIKIISDNQHNAPTRNKAIISQLIADNMPTINQYASRLLAHEELLTRNS